MLSRSSLQQCLMGLVLVFFYELKSNVAAAAAAAAVLVVPANGYNSPSPSPSPYVQDILLNVLKDVSSTTRPASTRQVRSLSSSGVNARDAGSGGVGQASLLLDDTDEPRQFCGETLYYVVEYYCVYVKGTSVYVDESSDSNNNNNDDEAINSPFNSSSNQSKAVKNKRRRNVANHSQDGKQNY